MLDEQTGLPVHTRPMRIPPFLAGVAILTLFFVNQILELFPKLGGLQLAKLTAVATMLIFLFRRNSLVERVTLRDALQLRFIVLILLLAAVTIPLSSWPSASWVYIRDVYAKNVLYVYLLVQAVKDDRDSRIIAGALVLGSTALALAVAAHFGPLVTYQNEPGREGLVGSYDPNDLALLYVITLPFAFFLLKGARKIPRLLLIGSIVIMMAGMFKSQSRGGFIGLLVIGFFIFLRGSRQGRKYTLVMLGVAVALFAFAAPHDYWNRINTIYNLDADYNMNVQGGRILVWQNGLKMIAESPLTGIGIACFPIEHARLSESHLDKAPHNSFLQAGAELGILGLFLFLAIIISGIWVARKVRLEARRGTVDPTLLWLASSVEISLIGFAVSGFFLSHAYSGIICFLAGISAALTARYRKIKREQQARTIEEVEYA